MQQQSSNDRNERYIRASICLELARDGLLPEVDARKIIDDALFDIDSGYRILAVHNIDVCYHGDELTWILGRCSFDPSLEYTAAQKMKHYPSKKLLPHLNRLLAGKSIAVRAMAGTSLWVWYQKDDMIEARKLLLAAQDSSDLMRAGAASFQIARDPKLKPRVEVMIRYLEQELANPAVTIQVTILRNYLRRLASQGDPRAHDLILSATKHRHPYVAEAAREALEILERADTPDQK